MHAFKLLGHEWRVEITAIEDFQLSVGSRGEVDLRKPGSILDGDQETLTLCGELWLLIEPQANERGIDRVTFLAADTDLLIAACGAFFREWAAYLRSVGDFNGWRRVTSAGQLYERVQRKLQRVNATQ